MDRSVIEFTTALVIYQHGIDPLDSLLETLYDVRVIFKNDPTQKTLYGRYTELWESLAKVWSQHAEFLVEENDESVLRPITSLAYFVGSLCAGESSNQSNAIIEIEPQLARILTYASSLANLEDERYTLMTRACCQAFSNLFANNSQVAQDYLVRRLALEETDQMISRLLASSDANTSEAVLSLVLNLIDGDKERVSSFVSSRAGMLILDRILILVDIHFDVNNPEGELSNSHIFSISFAIVEQILDQGAFPAAYARQSSSDLAFVISSPQVVLLKFLDGYLQLPGRSPTSTPASLYTFILGQFRALGTAINDNTRPKDARDAATFQGLVLILQCIITIGLRSETARSVHMNPIVEEIVVLLALCDSLVPKPVIQDLEEPWIEPAASAQLKRSLVQILGILSDDSKDAQDRIRESGGLALLLGLCQINDSNPTLREHALFSIRNILKNNEENQAMIENLKPQYRVGEFGELHDLPPAMR